MNQFRRQYDRWRQVVARLDRIVGERGHGRPVGFLRLVWIKAKRKIRSTGQHDVMSSRVVVGPMSERTAKSPKSAALGKFREVLADVDARCPGRNRRELSANLQRRVGL